MHGTIAAMQFLPWAHAVDDGFTLRGWHTPPSGKPLLHFLHGNGFCSRMYEPMLAHLAAHFDLWLCDVQGHGDSDHGGAFAGWNRNAEWAVDALRAQGQAFADVPKVAAGHSFGGVLTSLMLAQHPGLFQRAALLDPVLFTPAMLMGMSVAEATGMTRFTPLARQARARRAHWPDRASARASLVGRGVYKGWSDAALDAFVTHALGPAPEGGVVLKCRPEREAEVFGSAPERLWHHLGRVRTPTLVLRAERTFPFIEESVARWQLVNPVVSASQMPGGHCFMQERPEEAASAVTAFLAAIPPAGVNG